MIHLPRFALNEFTSNSLTFDQDLSLCRQLGVAWIEVAQTKLAESQEEARDQLTALREGAMKVCSVQPTVHAPFPDRLAEEPTDPEARMQHFAHMIELVGQSGWREIPLVTISGRAPEYDFRNAWQTAVRLYQQAADHAATHGLQLAFEPLHPVLMNVDTFICTLDEALRMIEAVGRPNFGLAFDTWHLWQERGLLDRIVGCIDRIFIVHLSDWPREGLRHVDDRIIPGQGRIDLAKILHTLETGGYRGTYCLEILSDTRLPGSLWTADPQSVVEQSQEGLRSIWPVTFDSEEYGSP